MMKRQQMSQCWQAVGIVLALDFIVTGFLWLLRLINTALLVRAEVPFVSLANLRRIITNHGGVAIAVVIELLLIWIILVVMLVALIIGLFTVISGQRWRTAWQQFWRALKHLRIKTLWVLLVDFIVLTPLFSVAFRTPLLTAIRIPEFLLDYGTRKWWLVGVTILIYLICWPLAIRYLYVWSLVNIDGQPIQQAVLQSKQRTQHGQWWSPVKRLASTLIGAGLISWVLNGFLYGLQAWLQPNNLWLSTSCLVIAEMVAVILCSWVLLRWTVILTTNDQVRMPRPGLMSWATLAYLAVAMNVGAVAYRYFQPEQLKIPMTVSHRGVADKDGVQNSISALKRTSRKYHPNYVEMDIHETKDHQFVVMHDENLQKLAGINKRPGELTLEQLRRLTIKENGYRAHIASLDEYLAAANQLHQKLIVELKTTQFDSKGVVKRFNRQYGQLIVKRHYLVHSLDYGLVQQLQRLNPRLNILYLQAYNFTNPQGNVPGFNNEYSTLNPRFIDAAHRQHQPVYAWTVNNRGAMRQLMNQQVDGIVTDKLPELQAIFRQMNRQQSRAERYWNYLNPIANLPE